MSKLTIRAIRYDQTDGQTLIIKKIRFFALTYTNSRNYQKIFRGNPALTSKNNKKLYSVKIQFFFKK